MIWIAGTSVSIETGGYVSRLAGRVAEHGYGLTNLSVGDETSLMGCMRVLSHQGNISAGDVLVWEYSLLDALIGRNFVHADVRDARRLAWDAVLSRGGHVIALIVPPRRWMQHLTRHERETIADAKARGQLSIDVRCLFEELEIKQPKLEFRDDRHLSQNSAVLPLLVKKLESAIDERHGSRGIASPLNGIASPRTAAKPALTWIAPEQFGGAERRALHTISNSLLTSRVASMTRVDTVVFNASSQSTYVGVISKANSGAIWCGHQHCPAVATALPFEATHRFLARTVHLPCRHRTRELSIDDRVDAPLRSSYGTRKQAGEYVEFFGLLCDFSTSFRLDRHLHRFMMALRRMRARAILSALEMGRFLLARARKMIL